MHKRLEGSADMVNDVGDVDVELGVRADRRHAATAGEEAGATLSRVWWRT